MKSMILGIAVLTAALIATPLRAAEPAAPTIAVAANFMGAMEKIVAAYERENGAKLQAVYSSTGKLYAQIRNGAPYDLFLAADARRPELLAAEGLCSESFTYATGEAVLWSRNLALASEKTWQNAVLKAGVKKIAISSPATAPYGAVAMAALEKEGLLPLVKSRLVYAHNVAQPFQFAHQGSVELGFTALSLALSDKGREGIFWRLPEAALVVQKGCIISKTTHGDEMAALLNFFKQQSVQSILNEFGYQ